jgi:hypothetical protein
LLLAFVAASEDGGPPPVPQVSYSYTLGDSNGPRPASFDRITYDRVNDELYAANGATVIVYKRGLETFRFTVPDEIGAVGSVAVLANGDFLVLSSSGGLFRCNYRGKLIRPIKLEGLTNAVGAFAPNALQISKGKVYLLDKMECKLLIVTEEGRFVAFRDLRAMITRQKEKKFSKAFDINGFSVDEEGNVLFTVATQFTAYLLSPRGDLRSFGSPGSKDGKFNIAGAIARDERGIIYVADVLRCVVSLFDSDFNFLGELGGRGYGRGDLIAPSFLAVGSNWLFVSQGGDRGISAFRVY